MYMKSIHSNESDQAITGTMRRHILSRLEKARKIAASLVDAIRQMNSSSADKLLLEAEAYQSLLSGTLFFEARKWSRSLEEYSITHVVYTNLVKVPSKQVESIQELLSSTIEPSIRYAAYQQKISRTVPIPQIVSKHLKKDSPTIQTLLKVDPECFDELSDRVESGRDGRILPKIINWRTRSVPIEDAAIAEALANVYEAEANFAKAVASVQPSPKEKAAAYDAILVPSQDAVDAAKTAIEELVSEGVPAADKRLQALQVTRTALSYDLISNRIGRYRVLCGSADGLNLEPSGRKGKAETINSKMTKLRECVVLYDSILQSLESINELPGVAADQALVKELDSKKAYFTTLRYVQPHPAISKLTQIGPFQLLDLIPYVAITRMLWLCLLMQSRMHVLSLPRIQTPTQ